MASLDSKLLKLTALALVICVMQISIVASPAAVAKSATTNVVLGKLVLLGNQTILVNGNTASTGTTIFSGSRLQTPDGVSASVQLGEAGRLSIEPNSNLTVTFDASNVDVSVTQGNAFLRTNAGVKGSITTPDGKTTASTTGPLPAPQGGGGGGTGAGVTLGAIGFVTIIVAAYLLSDSDNESP